MDHTSLTSSSDNLAFWRLESTFDLQAMLKAAISEQNDHVELPEPANSTLMSSSSTAYTSLEEELSSSEPAGPSRKKLKTGSALHAQNRNRRRNNKKTASQLQLRSEVIAKHGDLKLHKQDFSAFKLPHTKPGWIGLDIPTSQKKETQESLAELYKDGYKCVPVNDRYELLCLTSA